MDEVEAVVFVLQEGSPNVFAHRVESRWAFWRISSSARSVQIRSSTHFTSVSHSLKGMILLDFS